MFEVVRETRSFRVTKLHESKVFGVTFVEDKTDKSFDRIKFIRYGNEYTQPEIINVFRYEDEQLLEQMVKMYREQEVK